MMAAIFTRLVSCLLWLVGPGTIMKCIIEPRNDERTFILLIKYDMCIMYNINNNIFLCV